MAKKVGRTVSNGPCVDCKCFFDEGGEGPYRGRCLETGAQIRHIDAFILHNCFRLASWWVSDEDDIDEDSY